MDLVDPVDPEGGHASCGIDSAHLIDILAGLAHSNFNYFYIILLVSPIFTSYTTIRHSLIVGPHFWCSGKNFRTFSVLQL